MQADLQKFMYPAVVPLRIDVGAVWHQPCHAEKGTGSATREKTTATATKKKGKALYYSNIKL
jgi:hypothetical protein